VHVDIGAQQVAEIEPVPQVPRQLARDQRIVDVEDVGGERPRRMDRHRWGRGEEDHPAAQDGPRRRPGVDRNGDGDIDVDAAPVPPVERVDEIEPGRRRSAGLRADGFARLRHRSGHRRRGAQRKRQQACGRQSGQVDCHLRSLPVQSRRWRGTTALSSRCPPRLSKNADVPLQAGACEAENRNQSLSLSQAPKPLKPVQRCGILAARCTNVAHVDGIEIEWGAPPSYGYDQLG
jgi:hypothetical protein